MKRVLYACCSVVLLIFFLSGCGKTIARDGWEDLKYASDNYTLEDAKKAGYVIVENSSLTHGKDTWQEFVDLSSQKKKPCKVRVVHWYTIGEPEHYDPNYYESKKNDYPKMYIMELEYDGKKFRIRHYEGEKLYSSEFKYLMRYEGEAESPYATFTSYVRYILVNDDKVTWNDIMRSMISSRTGDYIPHRQVYADLVFKEGEQ